LEVSPALAHQTSSTIDAARSIHDRIARANLLVKVPATAEGIPAIRTLIAEGISINVTLIFSLERYDEVAHAYIEGLEAYLQAGGKDLAHIGSVASFFVSRVDSEVDKRLGALGAPKELFGKAAVAQAQVAYDHFLRAFSGPRWDALVKKGAQLQRPLWASTSTKNPAYSDLLYVDSLIGPNTVNTMPEATIDAFLDHGHVSRTIDTDLGRASEYLDEINAAGVDMADVAVVLEKEGVQSFLTSFVDLLAILEKKAQAQ
jgi:transaldolase